MWQWIFGTGLVVLLVYCAWWIGVERGVEQEQERGDETCKRLVREHLDELEEMRKAHSAKLQEALDAADAINKRWFDKGRQWVEESRQDGFYDGVVQGYKYAHNWRPRVNGDFVKVDARFRAAIDTAKSELQCRHKNN